MGKALLALILCVTTIQTLRQPFVGAMAYYCLAVWGPQYIWWWNFEGLRVSFIVALVAMASLLVSWVGNGLNLSLLGNRANYSVLILWAAYGVSYAFGPYVNTMGEVPWLTLVDLSKIILFYFVAVLLVNDLNKQKYFSWIIIASMIHLTYWANAQYLTQNWGAFNFGRLMGPTSPDADSIYRDENAFSMFFVTGIPFLFYWGLHMAKPYVRYALWLVIPLAWHAVFLTGSRGGLVGLCATILGGLVFSRKRARFVLLMIPVFLAAFYFQAGSLLKDRSETIVEYEGESSAETRLQAWDAAIGMLNAYPLTGVGPACFVKAMADFSPFQPRATHSVPLQFAAEIGVLALAAYCWMVWQVLWQGVQTHRLLNHYGTLFEAEEAATIRYLNESCSVSFFGLVVCSAFLSLNYYEIFYFLLIISCFVSYHVNARVRAELARQPRRRWR